MSATSSFWCRPNDVLHCHRESLAGSVRHHSRHASRRTWIRFAAKRFPSHSAEAVIRSRKPARSLDSLGRSLANETANSTYSSQVVAIVSVSPTLQRWLSEWRLANVSPGQIITGTPIHSASHVVIPPPNGKGSKAMSTSRYAERYSAYELRGVNSTRDGSTPKAVNRPR